MLFDTFDFLVYSFENQSSKSRHAYSLHIVDSVGCKWAEDNWYVMKDFPFLCVFLDVDFIFTWELSETDLTL